MFADFARMVEVMTVQLVSNYFVSIEVLPDAIETVTAYVRPMVPTSVKVEIRLETTFDVICRIIEAERNTGQGRRYGHPVIDIARELNRYLHPDVSYAGKGRQAASEVREALARKLFAALGNAADASSLPEGESPGAPA